MDIKFPGVNGLFTKDTPLVVLIRRFESPANPSLSRTVIICPTLAIVDRNTMVDWSFVGTSMTEVLFDTIVL